jgi:hypothetical protein
VGVGVGGVRTTIWSVSMDIVIGIIKATLLESIEVMLRARIGSMVGMRVTRVRAGITTMMMMMMMIMR